MKFNKCLIAAAVTFSMTSFFAHAQKNEVSAPQQSASKTVPANEQKAAPQEELAIKSAEAQLRTTFSRTQGITDFKESPIPGIFEFQVNGNIMYFYPATSEGKDGVVIMGKMYSSKGEDLSEKSKMANIDKVIASLPLSSAITIGPKDAPVFYEFTDPDCPYCHAYDGWIKEYSKTHPVQRKLVFLNNPGHPLAKAKIEHVICSKDKDEAVRYVYSEELPHSPDSSNPALDLKQSQLTTCPEAAAVMADHAKILTQLGVNGTPSFLFNAESAPKLIVGYRQTDIAEAINALEATKNASQTKPVSAKEQSKTESAKVASEAKQDQPKTTK